MVIGERSNSGLLLVVRRTMHARLLQGLGTKFFRKGRPSCNTVELRLRRRSLLVCACSNYTFVGRL
jgi:hypothetical protein